MCGMSLGSSQKTIHLAPFPTTLLLARGCDGSWKAVQTLALPPVVQVFNLCTLGADSYHVSTWSVCKIATTSSSIDCLPLYIVLESQFQFNLRKENPPPPNHFYGKVFVRFLTLPCPTLGHFLPRVVLV